MTIYDTAVPKGVWHLKIIFPFPLFCRLSDNRDDDDDDDDDGR